MFCEKCGNKLGDGDRFCASCGNKIDWMQLQDVEEKPVEKVEEKPTEKLEQKPVEERPAEIDDISMDIEEPYVQKATEQKKSVTIELPTMPKMPELPKLSLKSGNSNIIKIAAGAAVAIVLCIILVFAVKFRTHKIDLNKYVEVTYSGANGYGYPYAKFDEDAFYSDVIKYARVKGISKKQLRTIDLDAYYYRGEFDFLFEDSSNEKNNKIVRFVDVFYDWEPKLKFDKESALSNGDEVKLLCGYDARLLKEYGIKLTGTDKKYKVEGLKDVVEIDLLSRYSVQFSGISPFVTASVIDVNSEGAFAGLSEQDISTIKAYCRGGTLSKTDNIRNGETVTLTLDFDVEGLRSVGFYPSVVSKDFVCENVPSYVYKLEEIPEDMIAKMRQQGEDVISAEVANNWDEPESFKKQTFIGNYLCTLKESQSAEEVNYLYFIYKINVKPEEGKKFSYYYFVRFENIMILEDGSCSVDLSEYVKPESGLFSNEIYFEKKGKTYRGCEKLETLFNKCITPKVEQYEYVTNIEEQ